MADIVVRRLEPQDDRAGFQSGNAALDVHFQRYAGQNQYRHYIGVTYVAVKQGRIVGFASVATGSIEIDETTSPQVQRKVPGARYPLPILRLARLAVDHREQRQGVGSELLGHVLRLAMEQAGTVGCVGVVVDAKEEAVRYYEERGFLAMETVEGATAARPQPTPMFLSIRDIRAAYGG